MFERELVEKAAVNDEAVIDSREEESRCRDNHVGLFESMARELLMMGGGEVGWWWVGGYGRKEEGTATQG